MLSDGYQPAYDFDYDYGRQGELLMADLLKAIAEGQQRVEVKRKSKVDSQLYVELEQHPRGRDWKPSGLAVTTAEVWVYLVGDTGMFWGFPTVLLKKAVELGYGCAKDGGTNGDNPTRGRLLNAWSLVALGEDLPGLASMIRTPAPLTNRRAHAPR